MLFCKLLQRFQGLFCHIDGELNERCVLRAIFVVVNCGFHYNINEITGFVIFQMMLFGSLVKYYLCCLHNYIIDFRVVSNETMKGYRFKNRTRPNLATHTHPWSQYHIRTLDPSITSLTVLHNRIRINNRPINFLLTQVHERCDKYDILHDTKATARWEHF